MSQHHRAAGAPTPGHRRGDRGRGGPVRAEGERDAPALAGRRCRRRLRPGGEGGGRGDDAACSPPCPVASDLPPTCRPCVALRCAPAWPPRRRRAPGDRRSGADRRGRVGRRSASGRCARAGRRAGVLLAGVPRGLRVPRLLAEPVHDRHRCRRSPTVRPTSPAAARSWGRCRARSSLPPSASSTPTIVVPGVAHGWTLTDAGTICTARTDGAVAQLTRILGPEPDGVKQAADLLDRANGSLAPAGRPLFAGLLSLPVPDEPLAARLAPRRPPPRVPGRRPHRRVVDGRLRRVLDQPPHRTLVGAAAALVQPHAGLVRRRLRRRRRAAAGGGVPRRRRRPDRHRTRRRARPSKRRPTASAARSSTRSAMTSTISSTSSCGGAPPSATPAATSPAARTTSPAAAVEPNSSVRDALSASVALEFGG